MMNTQQLRDPHETMMENISIILSKALGFTDARKAIESTSLRKNVSPTLNLVIIDLQSVQKVDLIYLSKVAANMKQSFDRVKITFTSWISLGDQLPISKMFIQYETTSNQTLNGLTIDLKENDVDSSSKPPSPKNLLQRVYYKGKSVLNNVFSSLQPKQSDLPAIENGKLCAAAVPRYVLEKMQPSLQFRDEEIEPIARVAKRLEVFCGSDTPINPGLVIASRPDMKYTFQAELQKLYKITVEDLRSFVAWVESSDIFKDYELIFHVKENRVVFYFALIDFQLKKHLAQKRQLPDLSNLTNLQTINP